MHPVLTRFMESQGKVPLVRAPHDGGALLIAFTHEGPPCWVAKLGRSAGARQRLLRERAALEYLSPHAEELAIPRLLGWGESDGVACLVQSAIVGYPWAAVFNLREWRGRLPAPLTMALRWLGRFQQRVRAPRRILLRQCVEEWIEEALERPEPEGFSGALIAQIDVEALGVLPGVPVHGDFWLGNILFAGAKSGVVDWMGLETGTPFQDIWTLLSKLKLRAGRHWPTPLEYFSLLLDSEQVLGRSLCQWQQASGLTAAAARACFYAELVRRVRWELGLGPQGRSALECQRAAEEWWDLLRWLAARAYPDPFVRPVSGRTSLSSLSAEPRPRLVHP